MGTLQDSKYAQCPLLLSIVIKMRLVIRQSKLPACLAEVQLAHQNTLWHLCHRLVKLTDKMDEICINGKFSVQEPSERSLWVILLYFSLESRLIPAVMELGQVRLFWKLIRLRIWQLSYSCQTGVCEYFPSIKLVKYEDEMLILGQNDIFCGHNVVNFSVWFL